MKVAEQWLDFDLNFENYEKALEELRKVQLDALKEGMRRAAHQIELTGVGIDTVKTPTETYRAFKYRGNPVEAILTAAEQLTIKDL